MRTYGMFLIALFVSAAGVRFSNAEEAVFVSLSDFNALNERMAEQEQRLAAFELNGGAAPSSACFSCDTAPGITFAAELLFLKPFQSEGEAPGFDYQAAHRVSLGWTGSNGLGVRARWFDYNNLNPNNVGVPPLIEDFDMSVVDVEVTDIFQLGHWQGLLSGGVRFADYEEFGFFDADQMNDSFGLVIGLELTRPINERWALFATARDSFQFAKDGLDNGTPVEDMTFNIAEAQLGVQWNRPRSNGGSWFARAGAEAQYWSGGVIGDADSEDLGLFGGSFSVGLTR